MMALPALAQEEVAWESRKVRVMGRVVDQPRLIAYMADDPGIKYTYSGLTLDPKPWSPAVAEIKVLRFARLNCLLYNGRN